MCTPDQRSSSGAFGPHSMIFKDSKGGFDPVDPVSEADVSNLKDPRVGLDSNPACSGCMLPVLPK